MDLIKKYVERRKGSYFLSIILAIVGVVAGLFCICIYGKSNS